MSKKKKFAPNIGYDSQHYCYSNCLKGAEHVDIPGSYSKEKNHLSYKDKKKLPPTVSKSGKGVETFSASSNIGKKKNSFPKGSKRNDRGVVRRNVDGLNMSFILKLKDRPLVKSDIYAQTLSQLLRQLSEVSSTEAICNMLISISPKDSIAKKDRQLALHAAKAVDLIIEVIEEKFYPRLR
jgi:hypothetical protein